MNDPIFSRPLRVRDIHVVGNDRTHRAVFDGLLQGAKSGETVRDVSAGIMHALKALKEADCFEAVQVFCDTIPDDERPRNDTTEWTDLTISVREKRMLTLKAETYVNGSGSEGGVETSITLNNPVGHTEKVNAAVSAGNKSSAAMRLEVVKPRFRGLPFSLIVGARQSTISRAIYSSYDESIRDLSATLRHDLGRHEFGVGTAWRDISPIRSTANSFNYAASGLVIAQAKPSLKNSIRYTYTNDSRDNPYGPSIGSLFQARTEFAGFGGDATFIKNQVTLQQFSPVLQGLFSDASVGITFTTGILCPLNTSSTDDENGVAVVGQNSAISDRFWLGGPLSLRGFKHKGVGPRTSPKLPGAKGGDSLGGDVTWSLGYSLYLPFPHAMLHAAGMRCHLYANAGNLCAWETSFRTLFYGARASVGAGLVFPTPVGRVEANYSYVVRANTRDQKSRFQLGLGLDFL